MEANGQTLYNDDLLNILPDGVIILDINREVIQLNQQALTELHVHSSVNAADASSDQQDIQAVK